MLVDKLFRVFGKSLVNECWTGSRQKEHILDVRILKTLNKRAIMTVLIYFNGPFIYNKTKVGTRVTK